MNNSVILILTAMLILPAILAQAAQATSSGDGFTDGFAQGRADGKADAIANNPAVIHCGNEHSTAYCLGYRASYFATYDLWKVSHSK